MRKLTVFNLVFCVSVLLSTPSRGEEFDPTRIGEALIDPDSIAPASPQEIADSLALIEIQKLKKAGKKIPPRLIVGFPHLLDKIFPVSVETRLFNILSGRRPFLKIVVDKSTQRMQLFEARFASPLAIRDLDGLAERLPLLSYEERPLFTAKGLPIILPVTTGSHTVKSVTRWGGNREQIVGYTEPGTFVVKGAESQHYSNAFKCWLNNYCEFNDGAAIHESPHDPDELGLLSLIGTSSASGGCSRTTPAGALYIRKLIQNTYEPLYSEVQVIETDDTLECQGQADGEEVTRTFEIRMAADRASGSVFERTGSESKKIFSGYDGRMTWNMSSKEGRSAGRVFTLSNRATRNNPYLFGDALDHNTVRVENLSLELKDDAPREKFGQSYSGSFTQSFEMLKHPYRFDPNDALVALPQTRKTKLKCKVVASVGNYIPKESVLVDDPAMSRLFRGEVVRRQEALIKAQEKAKKEAEEEAARIARGEPARPAPKKKSAKK